MIWLKYLPPNQRLILIFLIVFGHSSIAQVYKTDASMDVRKALTFKEVKYGIKGDAFGGKAELRMFKKETYSTGGRSDPSMMFGCYVNYNAGSYGEIGWTIDEYFPWYCYIGFCQGDNANAVVIVKSNERRHTRTAIHAASQYYWVDGEPIFADAGTIKSVTLNDIEVVIELDISGNVDPCTIKGLRLPGIDLCIKDFIPDLSFECDWQCDFTDNNARVSSRVVDLPEDEARKVAVFPSPASDYFNIQFMMYQTGAVELNIFDLNGRLMDKKIKVFNSGNQKWAVRPNLLIGHYFLKLKGPGWSHNEKLMIIPN